MQHEREKFNVCVNVQRCLKTKEMFDTKEKLKQGNICRLQFFFCKIQEETVNNFHRRFSTENPGLSSSGLSPTET